MPPVLAEVQPIREYPSYGIAYQEIKPVRIKVNLAQLNIENALMDDQRNIDNAHNCAVVAKTLCVAIGKETTSAAYGLRLFLIETNNGVSGVRFKSTGSMEIWGIKPKFYRHPQQGSLMILAEENFDDFAGVQVFSFRQNMMKAVGHLPVNLVKQSILPHVLVAQEGNKTTFRFNRDLYRESPPGFELPAKKYQYNRIYYTYDDKVLQEFLSDSPPSPLAQSTQIFPDQVFASQAITGRFIGLVEGDYFYAKIRTAGGEKTFLIDSNEHCFLQQHRQESLKINYDVVDRYTPQLNGYRRVNIIRNIISRRTNLQKWRWTAARNC